MHFDFRLREQSIRHGLLGLLMIAPVALAACSSGLIGSSKAEPEEVDQLKRQVVEWRQRATVAELEGARLKREIARLEAELKTRQESSSATDGVGSGAPAAAEADPTDPATIGLGQEIEESDLAEPPPIVPAADPPATADDIEPFADTPEPAPIPSGDPPAAPAADVPTPADAASQPPGTAEAAVAPSAEAQALYDQGYALFNQKRYADAEERFDRFVKLYPRTDLADNALFWIGECRYARGDFSSALEAFSGTIERYPNGNKISDALFKAGRCLESLGDAQQARRTYQEVLDRYPGSASAARARDRLDSLR